MNRPVDKLGYEQGVLTLLMLSIGLALAYTNGLARWDWLIYDLLSRLWMRDAPEDIVIVGIDEHSLTVVGRWPWSRRIHAELIDKLSRGGAKVIGFDIILSEPDADDPEADAMLATAIASSGRVILPVLHEQTRSTSALQLTQPLAEFTRVAAGLGHINTELDIDGIARSVYLKAGLGAPEWPALSLVVLRYAEAAILRQLPGTRNDNLSTANPDNWVRDYRILVPFAGPPDHFSHISYSDFMDPSFPASLVAGKFVLVGATAVGLGDTLPTPVSGEAAAMTGVEFNANLIDALRSGAALEVLSVAKSLVLTSCLVLLSLLLYRRLNPRLALLGAAVLMVLIVVISAVLLRVFNLWFAPAPALLVVMLSYPLWTWRRLEFTVQELFDEKKRAQVTLRSIADGVIAVDSGGTVQYMNPSAEALTGFELAQAKGKRLQDVFPVTDVHQRRDLTDIVVRCLDEGRMVHSREHGTLVDRFGQKHIVRATAGPIQDEAGNVQGAVVGVSDISEALKVTQQMAYQATHDSLTDLPNRVLLLDRLYHAITRAQRSNTHVAVLLIDLDHFKKVNDGLGHAGGERLLKAVGARLKSCGREGDTVARIGGDEFVVLLENLAHSEFAAAVARKLVRLSDSPYSIDGQDLFVSSSIGISLFPKDGDSGEALLKNADTAMYRVKEQGRNNFHFFSEDMNDWIKERLQLEHSLRYAVERDELELHYQPQLNIRTGRINGVEALLRWRNAGQGIISPVKFIPIAEECGLILPIGEWVLESACKQLRLWKDAGVPSVRVAVNISPSQLLSGDIMKTISRVIDETGIDPANLELEITEGSIMKDIERSSEILSEFKLMGGQVSIDDFGKGYSSLSYLKRFPVDQLKIDELFVRDIALSQEDRAITLAIITMAQGLELNVVAEGVESRSQLSVLRAQQCDEIQGYYFSHPLSSQQMTRLLLEKPSDNLAKCLDEAARDMG